MLIRGQALSRDDGDPVAACHAVFKAAVLKSCFQDGLAPKRPKGCTEAQWHVARLVVQDFCEAHGVDPARLQRPGHVELLPREAGRPRGRHCKRAGDGHD